MIKSSQWFSIYLVTIVSCIGGVIVWLDRERAEPSPKQQANTPAISPRPTSSSHSREEIQSLAGNLALLNLTELEKVAKSMRAGFLADPEGTKEFVRSLSLQMAEGGKYEQALELSAFLFGIREVPTIERAVFSHWFQNGGNHGAALQVHLSSKAEANLTDDHHLSIVASILQYEHVSSLEKWTAWMAQRPQDDYLRQRLTTKLLHHSHPESAPQLVRFIESQPLTSAMAGDLPMLLKSLAPERPEEGLRWVASLNGEMDVRSSALAVAFADLVRRRPEVIRSFTEEDRFLGEILGENRNEKGLWEMSSRAFYQNTLQATLDLLSHTDPALKAELAPRLQTAGPPSTP